MPAPAAALLSGLPLYATLHFGDGWWSSPVPVGVWAVVVAGLMVSRLPTLSFKTMRVPSRLVAPLLVLVGLAAAVLVTVPFLGLGIVALVYLATIPYTMHRHRWLAEHPEAWNVPVQERRAVARAARSARRLGCVRRCGVGWRGGRAPWPGRSGGVSVSDGAARTADDRPAAARRPGPPRPPATACAWASAAPAAADPRVSVPTTPSGEPTG